ncbi:MAG: hypothetical protein P8N92_02075, partial [Burkholderiales bacterium]|nr:hypothetical protein [Burkholderiales bacterium]
MSSVERFFDGLHCNRSKLITILAFFMPVFFLTVKSWVTTSLFLLFFVCCWGVISDCKYHFSSRSVQFWIFLSCLIAPFFCELIPQVGRGEIVSSSLDGPSRMIMAAGVFVYLSKFDCTRIIRSLSYGSAVGVLGVFLSILFFPDYYWGSRAATYFVDPITLPCFTVGLLGLALFSGGRTLSGYVGVLIKFVLVVLVIYISIESLSRSAWVALICLLTVFIFYNFRRDSRAQF